MDTSVLWTIPLTASLKVKDKPSYQVDGRSPGCVCCVTNHLTHPEAFTQMTIAKVTTSPKLTKNVRTINFKHLLSLSTPTRLGTVIGNSFGALAGPSLPSLLWLCLVVHGLWSLPHFIQQSGYTSHQVLCGLRASLEWKKKTLLLRESQCSAVYHLVFL